MEINKKDLKLSRFLSLILRHKPETINIKLDNEGYANVSELIEGINKKGNDMTMLDLERIVKEDDKQRYSFNQDKTMIRANQGHSIEVNLKLDPLEPPMVLYHGTGKKYIDSITNQGIKKQTRKYVHLSWDMKTALKVGERHGGGVILAIDSKKMYEDGYKFYLSKNKVWLTDYVPTKYILNAIYFDKENPNLKVLKELLDFERIKEEIKNSNAINIKLLQNPSSIIEAIMITPYDNNSVVIIDTSKL